MADNITLPGSSSTIATDDVSGNHYQKVKLINSTADSTTATGIASDPLVVSAPSLGITVTPTINTSAYTAGDAVGGKQTLTNAVRASGGTALLNSVVVIDEDNQKAALSIILFESDPTAATITNNSAFVYSTDITKVVGIVAVAAADYVTIDSKAVATIKGLSLGPIAANATANLYAAVVTSGTPTYTGASKLTFKYDFIRD